MGYTEYMHRRSRNRAPALRTVPRAYNPIIRLWCLRCIHMGGGLSLRTGRRELSSSIYRLAGLGPLFQRRLSTRHTVDQDPELESAFQKVLERREDEAASLPSGTFLARNLRLLGDSLGLNQVDQDLIHLIVLSRQHDVFQEALESVGSLNRNGLCNLVARLLGHKVARVAQALDPASPLIQAGLLEIDEGGSYPFPGKVDLLLGIADQLTMAQGQGFSLFRSAFHKAPAPSLGVNDYPHLGTDLAVLLPYLREALGSRKRGVNILVHGSPGTGKTELARMSAQRLGVPLYEIASENRGMEPLEGSERFRAYRMAQSVLGNRGDNLILFDEVEDVFRPQEDGPRGRSSNRSGRKAWVNRLLEENPVPAFWVTNHLHVMDEAFIRRFDLVIQLEVPPRSVRRRILDQRLKNLEVPEATKARLAEHEDLSPAIIARAASVVRDALSDGLTIEVGDALTHVVGRTLASMGHSIAPTHLSQPITEYRPEVLNTDCDLARVLDGLRQFGSGRICLYGPPGTGKSAWGRHVAQQVDRPLLVKRASDLLNAYVGGTEARIAAMFREAQAERAVLLLDEADSFLQDRHQAQRSWEVTQVNELLTQMEAFEGIYIASTNLMDQLDAAALRRFDFKVKFNFLRPEQAKVLFLDAAARLGLKPEATHLAHLANLRKLTPGDFATVLRQMRMSPPEDVASLIQRLEAECRLKPGTGVKPIGFGLGTSGAPTRETHPTSIESRSLHGTC